MPVHGCVAVGGDVGRDSWDSAHVYSCSFAGGTYMTMLVSVSWEI